MTEHDRIEALERELAQLRLPPTPRVARFWQAVEAAEKSDQFEALERELAELRAEVAALKASTVHHHHYSAPTPAVEGPWPPVNYWAAHTRSSGLWNT